MEEYPSDLMGFYGQGYSISRFLIEMGGKRQLDEDAVHCLIVIQRLDEFLKLLLRDIGG